MEKPFEEWAIIELLGHRRLAGKVTEATILGGALLRIDVPGEGDTIKMTQFVGPQAIYSLTPTTEPMARAVAARSDPAPIERWELTQIPQRAVAVKRCRRCGCTEDNACMTIQGPCYWVEDDLCSVCAGKDEQEDSEED